MLAFWCFYDRYRKSTVEIRWVKSAEYVRIYNAINSEQAAPKAYLYPLPVVLLASPARDPCFWLSLTVPIDTNIGPQSRIGSATGKITKKSVKTGSGSGWGELGKSLFETVGRWAAHGFSWEAIPIRDCSWIERISVQFSVRLNGLMIYWWFERAGRLGERSWVGGTAICWWYILYIRLSIRWHLRCSSVGHPGSSLSRYVTLVWSRGQSCCKRHALHGDLFSRAWT